MGTSLSQRIDEDLKKAMLARDRERTSALRNLKSVLGYAALDLGVRDQGLDDQVAIQVLRKEAKKREESAVFYRRGNEPARAEAELQEKAIIESYLPPSLSEAELSSLIDRVIAGSDSQGPKALGEVIGKVREESGGAADGSLIARLVKEKLELT